MQEIFFRPPVLARRAWTMPVPLFRACRSVLRSSGSGCAFVPIRSMQYQAVIDAEEIVFVDGQGGYVVRDGQGGRVIVLSWRPAPTASLDSLSEPVPCELVFHRPDLEDIQRRLVGEFRQALDRVLQKHEPLRPFTGARILTFDRNE